MTESSALKITTAEDVVRARAHGRECARALGFGSADQTRLATAISELTRNALVYAGSGACRITDESDENLAVVSVIVEDEGPGIPDIDKAMQDGYSTDGGLGAGLPGAKRLVSDFHIESRPGQTRIAITLMRRKADMLREPKQCRSV